MDGWAVDVPVRGTLTISPRKRQISYALSFEDSQGRTLVFTGSKHVRLLRLMRTMTNLRGEVRDLKGRKVADVTMRFRLKALLPMMRSFRV